MGLLVSFSMVAGALQAGSVITDTSWLGSIYVPPPTPPSGAGPVVNLAQTILQIDPAASTMTGLHLDGVVLTLSSPITGATGLASQGASNGCGSSASAYLCSDLVTTTLLGIPSGSNSPYSLLLNLPVTQSTLLAAGNGAPIQARYINASGNRVGALVSADFTLGAVPEPTSVVLLITVLVSVGFCLRRTGG